MLSKTEDTSAAATVEPAEEMPHSNGSDNVSKRDDSSGSQKQESTMLQARVGKLLAERMVQKETKQKLRADLEGYMSVSESENEEEKNV